LIFSGNDIGKPTSCRNTKKVRRVLERKRKNRKEERFDGIKRTSIIAGRRCLPSAGKGKTLLKTVWS